MSEDTTPYAVAVVDGIPTLVIEAEGKIITSNFDQFAAAVRARLAEFDLNLRTDEDFDRAAEDAKAIKAAETALKAAKEQALAQAEELNSLFGKIDDLTGELSTARLALTKQIDARKAELKSGMIDAGMSRIEANASARQIFRAPLENAVKGMKSFDSMREKIRVEVSTINDRIERNKRTLADFERAYGNTMTADRDTLECADPVFLDAELKRRKERAEAAARESEIRKEAEAAQLKLRQEAEAAQLKLRQEAETAKAAEAAARAELAAKTSTPEGALKTAQEFASSPAAPFQVEPAPPEEEDQADEEQEWQLFRQHVLAVFAPLKSVRAALTHERNQGAAKRFAEAVNDAWQGVNQSR